MLMVDHEKPLAGRVRIVEVATGKCVEPWQAKRIRESVRPGLNYLQRLRQRIQAAGLMEETLGEVEEAPPGWLEAVVPHAALLEPVLQVHPVVSSIAHTVSRFCNERAVSESEGWQVRIPLREDVLAGTTLHLMLSPLWLQVRFETSEQRSRDLLLAHRESLASLLDAALSRRREIAISID